MASRLTAILCNYNHGATVGRAIEAMLTQSRPPDELVIVEDGSTDHSHDVISIWAEREPRIRYLQNEKNLGLFASFAKALASATGDYIYSGAADDYVLPGFFAAVMECGERFPQAPVISAKVVTALPDGRRTRVDGYAKFSTPVYLTPAEYLRECLLPEPPTMSLSSATIYRRDALLAIGGWRAELGSWADTFSIRALSLKQGFCYVPHESVVWVIQPEGISQSTVRNRDRAARQVRLAVDLMRSPEFAPVFPESYVRHWEQQMREVLIRQQLQPMVDAYQTVQAHCRQAAAAASWPERITLGIFRRLMTACYLAAFHVQQRILRRELARQEQAMPPQSP